MFSVATPKFAPNTLIKLREGINFWMNRKELVHYTKGHEFVVISSHISHKYEECHAAFEESGEIIYPDFFYELQDKDGHTLTAYEEMLKRVKLENKLPSDDEEEEGSYHHMSDTTETLPKKQTPRKPTGKSAGFKPILVRSKPE